MEEEMAAPKLPKGNTGQNVGKSKVIKSSTPSGVRGGSTKMFGKQTVKAAKSL